MFTYAPDISDVRIVVLSRMKKKTGEQKTYNSRDSLVVTHPTTNRPACGLNAVNTRVGALAGDGG
jgi:hypothetical protein